MISGGVVLIKQNAAICSMVRSGHPHRILLGASRSHDAVSNLRSCSQHRQSFDTAVDVVAEGLKHECRSLRLKARLRPPDSPVMLV